MSLSHKKIEEKSQKKSKEKSITINPPQKLVKIEVVEEAPGGPKDMNADSNLSSLDHPAMNLAPDEIWIRATSISLSYADKETLTSLNDHHIDFGQHLIKNHHPDVKGLKSSLSMQKESYT